MWSTRCSVRVHATPSRSKLCVLVKRTVASPSARWWRRSSRVRPGRAAGHVGSAAGVLTPVDRNIVQLRFRGDLTQAEIAHRLGLSEMQISRIVRRSITRMQCLATPGAWV